MSFRIHQIAQKIGSTYIVGNENLLITNLVDLCSTNENKQNLMWCSDKKKKDLKGIKIGCVIISDKIENHYLNDSVTYIIVKEPRRAFSDVIEMFLIPDKIAISESSQIDFSAKIGKNVSIGHNVVIEKNCVVGNNTIIGHNTVLRQKTIIGNNVIIGSNTSVGGTGFGYMKDDNDNYKLINHIGNVIISNNVEIGSNTSIDRAVIGSTFIGKNTKIDNNTQISHGVKLGTNCIICASAVIAGSAQIGNDVWVGPSSSIINKGIVEDGAFVGMSTVVIRKIKEKHIVQSQPSKIIKQ